MFSHIFFKNFCNAIKNYKVWQLLGWLDIYKRYRRSKLGQMWIVISTLVITGSMSFIFSNLFEINYFIFLVYILNNLCLWNFLRENIEDSTVIFLENKTLLLNNQWNHLILIFRLITKNVITYSHNLILIIPINILFNEHFTLIGFLIFVLNFILVLPLCASLSLTMAIISARFRDIRILTTNIMQLIFFLTPVIYQKIKFEKYEWIFDLNIFAILLEFVNNPLNNLNVSLKYYFIIFMTTIIITFLSSFIYQKKYKRINYWL